MRDFVDRLKEGSTYAGVAAVVIGGGQLLDWDEAPQVAGIIQQAGEQAVSGNWYGALAAAVLGVAAIFLPDRGGRR